MLCSKCHENIPQGKEMQIEGTIVCKECALVIEKANKEKVIARCWSCNQFIYKGELIHEGFRSNSKNFSKWFSIETGSSEKLFQCDECYQVWRNEVKKSENWSKLKSLFLGFCIGVFLYSIIELFFPEIHKRMHDNPSSAFTLMISFFIIVIFLGSILEINKYKVREKEKKKAKK